MVHVHAHIVDIQSIGSGRQVRTVHACVCFCHLKAWYHRHVSVWLQVQSIQAFVIYSRADSAKDNIDHNNRFQTNHSYSITDK